MELTLRSPESYSRNRKLSSTNPPVLRGRLSIRASMGFLSSSRLVGAPTTPRRAAKRSAQPTLRVSGSRST